MKTKILFIIFIIFIFFQFSCGTSQELIEATKITNKQNNILLIDFQTKDKSVFSSDEVYGNISNKFSESLYLWLEKTEGFNEIKLLSEIESIPEGLDPNNISISENNVNEELLSLANTNGFDRILYPKYTISNTIESTDSYYIYDVNLNLISILTENRKIEFNESFSTVLGVDISLYQGKKSIMSSKDESNSEELSEEKEKEKELNIAETIINSFEYTIQRAGNRYAEFLNDKSNNSESQKDTESNEEDSETNNETEEDTESNEEDTESNEEDSETNNETEEDTESDNEEDSETNNETEEDTDTESDNEENNDNESSNS
ncbi:MAG: hypothetical protein ACOCUI_03455 [bacterium]